MNATNHERTQRHGLLAPSDTPPENALVRGLLTGSAITVAMLLFSTLLGIAAIGMTEGLAISLSSIIAGIAGGILQQTWFNPNVLGTRLTYASRIPLFGITYFVNKVRAHFNLRGIWIVNRIIGSVVAIVSLVGLAFTLMGESLY